MPDDATTPTRPALSSAAREAMERLNAEAGGLHIWLRTQANAPAQRPWFKDGGIVPGGTLAQGRVGANQMKALPHRWRWREIGEAGDPYEGVSLRFVNPATGASVFPTLDYSAQLLRPGEETRWKRETANVFYIVLEGSGATEIAGESFDWQENDIFVVPNFLWRRHVNRGAKDSVLYAVSDMPLLDKIGQYRAQGRDTRGEVVQLVA